MSQKSKSPWVSATACKSATVSLRIALLAAAFGFAPSSVHAQSWADARTAPPLWQIIAVDKTGEVFWPYGREDLAGDGTSFLDDESSSDIRTVYAEADADSLWLRAYVSSAAQPGNDVRAFFFLDSDANPNTGGDARGAELDSALSADLSDGGYEWAIAVRAGMTMGEVWRWDASNNRWGSSDVRPASALQVETGVARDPIALGSGQRGYLQLRLTHAQSGLSASCAGNIFVRTRHEGSATRAFGDDVPTDVKCRAAQDSYGDPDVLRSYECSKDADCFAGGRCADGLCLFAYECGGNSDCRTGEQCSSGQCVRVVTSSCSTNAQCDGLICEGARCVACTSTGARACQTGLTCSPNGACADPDDYTPSNPTRPGSSADKPGNVEGGALNCSTSATRAGFGWTLMSLFGLALVLRERRRRSHAQRAGRTS